MRISTNQIYDTGALGIQRNQSTLYKLQNQLSSGRRVLTPEDDPVAAAQALLVTQTKEVNGQHVENQGNASGVRAKKRRSTCASRAWRRCATRTFG